MTEQFAHEVAARCERRAAREEDSVPTTGVLDLAESIRAEARAEAFREVARDVRGSVSRPDHIVVEWTPTYERRRRVQFDYDAREGWCRAESVCTGDSWRIVGGELVDAVSISVEGARGNSETVRGP